MLYGGAHSYRYIWKLCQNIVHNRKLKKSTWETTEILSRTGNVPQKRFAKVWKPTSVERRNDFFAQSMTSSAAALRSALDDMYHRAPSQLMGYIKRRIALVYEEAGESKQAHKLLQQLSDLFPLLQSPEVSLLGTL